jgi:hypothetical protein
MNFRSVYASLLQENEFLIILGGLEQANFWFILKLLKFKTLNIQLKKIPLSAFKNKKNDNE